MCFLLLCKIQNARQNSLRQENLLNKSLIFPVYTLGVKKFIGSTIPFFFFHLVCCGALLIFLTTSGYLLLIRQEGDKKVLLLPLLLVGGIFFFLHWYWGRCCEKKGHKSIVDHIFMITLYIAFSFIFGTAFMIYVFIPWWIPNYKGGFLLP